jgi:prepilin-type N-terminal cleavage/methylation domain-containing protein
MMNDEWRMTNGECGVNGGFSPRLRASAFRLPPACALRASARRARVPQGRTGFTLMEMLTVMVIISILIGVTGMAMVKARELARRTRAETELREMVSAWLQYHQLYKELPSVVRGKDNLNTTREVLDPLINAQNQKDNPRGIVLLNPKLPFNARDEYIDPWGTFYRLSFAHAVVEMTTAMKTSISFPGRQRRFP